MKAGKILAPITVMIMLVYYAIIGLKNKSERSDKPVEKTIERTVTIAQPEVTTPVLKSLKADEWSEWIFIMGRKVTIFPNDESVIYELKDPKGNVRSAKGGKDWKDMTQYERFKSTTDITYIVEKI